MVDLWKRVVGRQISGEYTIILQEKRYLEVRRKELCSIRPPILRT